MNTKAAARLAEVFGVLASETRLRLLHALERNGEFSPTALADAVGMKVQAVSNQLQRLFAQGIVGARREGNQVFYRIEDPCVAILLDHGLCLAEDAK
jgi:ArsR family transcriptional regulator, lead/cadmium/zinc/bismuth-responsive transcriptional repressor